MGKKMFKNETKSCILKFIYLQVPLNNPSPLDSQKIFISPFDGS